MGHRAETDRKRDSIDTERNGGGRERSRERWAETEHREKRDQERVCRGRRMGHMHSRDRNREHGYRGERGKEAEAELIYRKGS